MAKEKHMQIHDHLREISVDEHTAKDYPEEIYRALEFAAEVHAYERRKLDNRPFVAHPKEVAEIVRDAGGSLEEQIAAILHDTVEASVDINGRKNVAVAIERVKQIRQKFGDEVAEIVVCVTKDYLITDRKERQQDYLRRLGSPNESPRGSVVVALGDKIHNISDLIENYITLVDNDGNVDDMWKKFKGDPKEQLAWYSAVLEIGLQRTPDSPLNSDLKEKIDIFRSIVLGKSAAKSLQLDV